MNSFFETEFIGSLLAKFEDDQPAIVKHIFYFILNDHKTVLSLSITTQ